MGINDSESIFLTQEEHDLFLLSQPEVNFEESEDYKQGFEIAIMEEHKHTTWGVVLCRIMDYG